MKIQYVGFKNIMGIKELEFIPGKVTLVEGKNGRGKTSVLKGIQAAIGGGHDATLLTEGEKKGEIVIVLDDGTKLEKKIKRDKSTVKLQDREGKDIPRAASYLKEIVDDIAVNPIKILTASNKDRVKLLLDSVPMETPFADLEGIMGTGPMDREDTRHPMQIISELRKSVYDDRTDNNRYLKERKTMVDNMRQTIPFKADEVDYTAQLKELQGKRANLRSDIENSEAEDESNFLDQKAAFERERDDAIEKARNAFHANMDKLTNTAFKASKAIEEKNTPLIAELDVEIGKTEALAEETTRVAFSIKYVKEWDQEIRKLESEIEEQTETIKALDDIKASLLTNLPFDGLEVKDGEIYLDGVPFDSVNKAKRIQFALAVAGLRKAELPIVCVDELEALDEESFQIFQDLASKTDMQFFVTRVSEDMELQVKTDAE